MYLGRSVSVSIATAKKLLPILQRHGDTKSVEQIASALRFASHKLDVRPIGYSIDLLKDIVALELTDEPEFTQTINATLRIAQSPDKPFGLLKMMVEAFKRWMVKDAIDGWLYSVDDGGRHFAWAVKDIEYSPQHGSGDNYVPASVKLHLFAYNAQNHDGEADKYLAWNADSVVKKSIAELMLEKGLFKETPELRAQYDADLKLFTEYQPQYNTQFVTKANPRTTVRGSVPPKAKLVNDEETKKRKTPVTQMPIAWESYGPKEGQFTTVPLHPYIYFYDLARYQQVYLHADEIEPYVYDKTMIDKLVLPQTHRDLIDVLTQDMDVFVEDIVAGKGGGTAILCYGEPGLGKTLTAEVYSEIVERPLYKVHSGQLGVTAQSVEVALKDILQRAERWGAILLLDEADVYVAKRGNDLGRNAVVAAFLRSLEYFNGLLFMTTNRIDDVDDAIVSRMIALFHYDRPDADMAHQLWTILAKQFDIDLNEKHTAKLIETFPTAAGRDIKMLLKLVKKYCARKGVKISMEAFRVCAMFRGIDAVSKATGKIVPKLKPMYGPDVPMYTEV